MKKAKRNRRTATVGMTPVPTPVMYRSTLDTQNASSISFVYLGISLDQPDIVTGDLIATGAPTNVKVYNQATGLVAEEVTATVIDNGGLAGAFYEWTTIVTPGTYIILSPGFDPAIRGRKGEMLDAWVSEFTVV